MGPVVLNGLFVGAVYGLLGVGVVMAYRGSRVVNFAHAETGLLAAFVYGQLRFAWGPGLLPEDNGLWPALPVAIVIGAAVGALIEVAVVRPLRNAPRIRPLVGTFAVATLLFVYAARQWGLDAYPFASLVEGEGTRIYGLLVQPGQFLIVIVSGGVLVALWALYRFTPFGLRMRALAVDPYAAGLVGVNVNRTSMGVWAMAGAIAAVSAILIGPLVAFSVEFMAVLTIWGLAAALVGGLTNIGGTFSAGILLGVAQAVIAFKIPITGITDVALAAAVLLLMLVRPTGVLRAAY